MKRFFASVLFVLALGGSAGAGPSPSYINYGDVFTPPVIDATAFVNYGIFDLSLINSVTNLESGLGTTLSGLPYSTRDTLYYTNQNLMFASPGFRFDTATATTRYSASSFFNSGTITGIDTPGFPYAVVGSSGFITFPNYSVPLPSQLLVLATNIANQGTLSVGSVGLVQLTGKNVNLANGALVAGAVSDTQTNDLTGQATETFGAVGGFGFFVDPPEIYDLWWGATNGDTLFLPWTPPFQPVPEEVGVRSYEYLDFAELPVNFSFASQSDLGTFEPFVYEYTVGGPTNVYINMVFLNTNFLNQAGQVDTNITASVGFTEPFAAQQAPLGDPNGIESVVQFSEPVQDVISGDLVTNAVYFMDAGAAVSPMGTNINTEYTTHYSRPNSFEITTDTPIDWLEAVPADIAYDPGMIYADGSYQNNKVTMTNSSYAAQIGRNPENVNGFFLTPAPDLSFGVLDLPDVTNEPARLEVNAGYLNINNSRFRAEGVVTLNGSNVVGNPNASDWGNVNANLAATNGFLLVSNVFPATFKRIRGDIYAWGVNWMNVFTNGVTNTIHYHVLILDQNLTGTFRSSVRNLDLQATNIVVIDPIRVINNDIFVASNLTINSAVTLTQNAGNVDSTNIPNLKNLLIGTNGSITADGVLDLGYPQSLSQTTPAQRKYSMLSLTNFGAISATGPLIQARSIENDGSVTATNGGSMVINANSIGLSQAGINTTVLILTNFYVVAQTNTIAADANISISSASIIASNSVIQAGVAGFGSLNLDVTSLLTDNTPSTPTTNDVLVNFWQTTGGFSLTAKPTTGDLFGTQIKSIVTGHNVANHVWAGIDYGATAAGFSNNVVIGRLILDRQTNSAIMHFSGAGQHNGMYVDYLELDDASYTDYRDGLEIDPSLTIYFAASTADPIKLEQVYPGRLVWVPNFTGPNSAAEVPYLGGGFCLMNLALADSPDIDTANDGVPNEFNPFPLNNITNGAVIPCPSGITILKAFAATGTVNPANLVLSVYGQGTVTPELKPGTGVVMGHTYSFSAAAAPGWLFDGWTGTYPTKNSSVTFTMQPSVTNVNLTAKFVPTPFPALAGSYNGLFSVSGAVAADSSGFVTFSVNSRGVFSGQLRMGPNIYTFSGQFGADGSAGVTAKHGSTTLTVDLQLDTSGQSDEVSGNVVGGQWTASLLGHRTPVWTGANPAPQQGRYTMLLPGGDAPTLPGGNSYGTVTVTGAGNLTLAGTLADGVAISQAVPVSKAGQWPLYSYAPGGQDTVLGWVGFATDGSGFSGNINWIKAAGAAHYYPGGFLFSQELTGARYTPPAPHAPVLSITNAILTLTGGNLAENLTNSIAFGNGFTYSATNGSVILNINPATGGFSGSFVWPGTHRTTSIGGVVLQSEDSGGGFFLGTNQSGSVLLQGK